MQTYLLVFDTNFMTTRLRLQNKHMFHWWHELWNLLDYKISTTKHVYFSFMTLTMRLIRLQDFNYKTNVFVAIFSPGACLDSWTQTLDLGLMRRVCHCATATGRLQSSSFKPLLKSFLKSRLSSLSTLAVCLGRLWFRMSLWHETWTDQD
jgi:hypothetical protein